MCFEFKLLFQSRRSGRINRHAAVSWVLVIALCGCCKVFEKDFIRVGHPVLTVYSSHEWSSLWVREVEKIIGLGRIFWDVRGVRNHI